jgi:hypothetical protein
MLPVSVDFQNAILAPTRRIKGKVRISYSDPFLDPSVETTVNEKAYISWENQVVTISIDQETEESAMTHKFASLDGTWILDGTWHLAPDTEAGAKINHFGWWGTQLAGPDGFFTEPYPALTASFSARTVVLLALQGDSKRGEWPVNFKIHMYDASDTLLNTVAIVDNTEISWQLDIEPVDGVTKMVLQVEKWSHPGRQVKLAGFFSVLIENYVDEIMSISLLEEREFSTGNLPIGNISANEITIQLSNADHRFDAGNTESQLYGLIKMNRKIKAWLGVELPDKTIEYAPLGVFYANDWAIPENSIGITVTGRDRLELLTLDNFSAGVLQNITLYDLATAVLNHAGIVNRYIDPELQNYLIPYAYFDDVSHRECLRTIAQASLSQVYVDRLGVLRIEGPSYLETNSAVSVTNITGDDYFDKDNPNNYNDLANYIVVKTQPLAPAAAEEVYETKDDNLETIGIGETKTILIFYKKKPVINASISLVDAPSGTSITNIDYYAWGAEITVLGGSVEGTFKISATGNPLEVQGSQPIIAQDKASIREHGKKTYTFEDNPLIQTVEMAQTVAQKCLALSKDSRRDLDLNWRGNPALQLGDRITVPNSKTTTADFYIVSQNLEFDGGLRVTTKGKKVQE